jgi:ubiquinone/menaquinone biosynthesis C-methylase UbiE
MPGQGTSGRTKWWSGAGSNCRPSAFQACQAAAYRGTGQAWSMSGTSHGRSQVVVVVVSTVVNDSRPTAATADRYRGKVPGRGVHDRVPSPAWAAAVGASPGAFSALHGGHGGVNRGVSTCACCGWQGEVMPAGFSGEVVDFYAKYRRGYDPVVIDWLAEAFTLDNHGVVLDLGCGTGQLTIPVAARAHAVIGMDPEPDMLARAKATAASQGCTNIAWLLGSDRDLPTLTGLLGDRALAAITMANAIHLMDHERLFHAARPLLRPGGGVAVLANGMPLWRQPSAVSQALRACLERWFNVTLVSGCGTDQQSREQYAAALKAVGYADVRDTVLVDYEDVLGLEHVIGNVYSAIPAGQLPALEQRPAFEERIRQALPDGSLTERVRVAVLTGRVS